jgi:hypothetical protein
MAGIIDNTGACQNFILKEGMVWNQEFIFSDDLDDPIDLSQYDEIHLQCRKKKGDPVIFEAKLTTGEFVVSGVDNDKLTINVQIPNDCQGNYHYDTDFIGDSANDPYLYGQIVIKYQITEQTA